MFRCLRERLVVRSLSDDIRRIIMLVKEAIRLLQEYCDPEETIVVGWWTKQDFSENMPDQEWEIRTRNIDHNIDWSRAHENIVAYLWEED